MEITQTFGARFDLALERFRAGESLSRGSFGFKLAGNQVECRVATIMSEDSVTESRAKDALRRARAEFEALLRDAPALKAAVAGRPVRYILIEDYGKGPGWELAEQIEDEFRWGRDARPKDHDAAV